jgi:hypothetical protein
MLFGTNSQDKGLSSSSGRGAEGEQAQLYLKNDLNKRLYFDIV